MSIVLVLVFVWLAFVVGWVTAPGRETTVEARTAKLREKSYARWYAAQLVQIESARQKAHVSTYRPHKAVNMLPAGYAQVER